MSGVNTKTYGNFCNVSPFDRSKAYIPKSWEDTNLLNANSCAISFLIVHTDQGLLENYPSWIM